jgi:hypothetical protein
LFPEAQIPIAVAVPAVMVLTMGVAAELFDGTYHLTMAADAEGWTSKDLRKALGAEWKVVDWISFEYSEADHVVVGPGGVFAIEAKYTDSIVDLDSARGQRWAQRAVDQAIEGARSVSFLLGRHQCRVDPVVVIWGSEVTGSPAEIDGVPILAGRDVRSPHAPWQQNRTTIAPDHVASWEQRLIEYRAMRLADEAKR